MQMNKFIVRLATYHDGGFKEGVSLTVYDELARWEKYVFASLLKLYKIMLTWLQGTLTAVTNWSSTPSVDGTKVLSQNYS